MLFQVSYSNSVNYLHTSEIVKTNSIIRFFSERLMNDVIEEIFNYLDYESLKNSEAVSSLWYNNLLYGKTWKKLLDRNVRQNIIN